MPPPPPEEFDDLPLRQQFAYIIPILHAIIRSEYGPAMSLHDQFMLGGAARSNLKRESPAIGPLKETLAKRIWSYVDGWILGRVVGNIAPNYAHRSFERPDLPVRLRAHGRLYHF